VAFKSASFFKIIRRSGVGKTTWKLIVVGIVTRAYYARQRVLRRGTIETRRVRRVVWIVLVAPGHLLSEAITEYLSLYHLGSIQYWGANHDESREQGI
jgi:energy-coupling factor transporter ATP-binding protein EcfA2